MPTGHIKTWLSKACLLNTVPTFSLRFLIMNSKSLFSRLSVIVGFLLLTSCGKPPSSLTMLVMPIDSISETRDRYKPFLEYLETNTNRKINLINASSDADVKNLLLGKKKFDIVHLNGVLFSEYYNKQKYTIFAQETSDGQMSYNSVFIANHNSHINDILDIKGTVIGLNNKYSTSGSLVPVLMLAKYGLKPNLDYNYKFFNSPLAVVDAVSTGKVKVGAVSWKLLRLFFSDKSVDPESIRIIGVSFPIPSSPWLFNKNLPISLQDSLSELFFQYSNKNLRNTLGLDGFVPASSTTHYQLLEDRDSYDSILNDK